MSSPSSRVSGRADLAVAAAFALAAGLLFAATLQTRMYGDGGGLVSMFASGEGRGYHNVLYLPYLRAFDALVPGGEPIRTATLASALAAALGCGATWLVARGLGASREGAALATALAAVTPATWFFATTAEVPAPHFAAVALCAAVVLRAPWRRPGLALALVAATFPLLALTHQTAVLLGPGWVALVAYARARVARPFGAAFVLGVVGPLLLAALVATLLAASWYRTGELALFDSTVTSILDEFTGIVAPADFLWRGWVRPLALVLPLALAGAWTLRREPLALTALLVSCAVPFAFFTWWGVPEHGAYFLGTMPFYAALVARAADALRPAARRALFAVALVVQALLGRAYVAEWDRGYDPYERVEHVRAALGESGVLLSTASVAPRIDVHLPGIEEHSLIDPFARAAAEAGFGPDQFVAAVLPAIDQFTAGRRIAFETNYRELAPSRQLTYRVAEPYFDALLAALRERRTWTEHPHEHWGLVVFEP